jgi:thiamine pyrophosphate-dependent acetolactate synthase large subunit-like protein
MFLVARWNSQPNAQDLLGARALIEDSKRPVLIAGHGARHAAGKVQALAQRLRAPVLTTFKAKGLIPDTHPLGAGSRAVAELQWPAG